ncbi:hypothetical protein [Streptomyces sp. A5-4]|uniref:hypothetical protein n=1 Tax=Streptomyces sp. A5-4 TaxID=3384771 RepID=UPI003DA848FD
MNRRTLPAAVVFAAATALLLTACGGGDEEPKDKGKIAGAETGDAQKKESPSASAKSDAGRPEVKLPDDIKAVFQNWKTGDPKSDAVLADAAHRIDATNYAIAQGDADEPTLGFYYKGDALIGAAQWVKEFKDAGKSMTGTTRFFDPDVKVQSEDLATLTYCSFEGEAYVKDRKTGKAKKTPVTDKSYSLFSTRLEKTAKGVWQTSALDSQRGNDACTP